MLRDETERLKTEMSLRQSEKLAVVGRMASSIAHEINNPLEAVTNLIYLARRGVVSPEVGEFLEQAERELARVSHITTATLRFHRQTAEPHLVDIEEILESVLVLYEGRLKAMQVAIERRYSLHPSISCQAVEVRQVIANLVSNAIDAMLKNTSSAAGCAIAEGCGSGDGGRGRPGNDCGFGCGNPGVDAEHVFEPFFTTKSATGTGLGLWLSSETVTKHQRDAAVPKQDGRELSRDCVFAFFEGVEKHRTKAGLFAESKRRSLAGTPFAPSTRNLFTRAAACVLLPLPRRSGAEGWAGSARRLSAA